MTRLIFAFTMIAGILTAQPNPQTTNAQGRPYKPGDFQNGNPNYPARNPFYFEGRVDWDLLQIGQPSNAWEYAQRGIHYQDDLGDAQRAIADYRQSISMNNLADGSCRIVTSAAAGFGQSTDPPPCMFTVRLRLANLLQDSDPQAAVNLFREVLQIDPLRLGVNAMLGETYVKMAQHATDENARSNAYSQAIQAYQAELALSPVTAATRALTGDEANNAHVHWELGEIYRMLGRDVEQARELDLYLKATRWHSDTYSWRIQLAQKRLEKLQR